MFLWGSGQITVQDELDRKSTSSNNVHDLSRYLSRCLRPWFTKIRSLYHMWSRINALRFGTCKDEWLAFRNSLGIPKSSISFIHKLQWVKFTSELSDETSLLSWTSNTLFQVLSASLLDFSFWPGRWRGGGCLSVIALWTPFFGRRIHGHWLADSFTRFQEARSDNILNAR